MDRTDVAFLVMVVATALAALNLVYAGQYSRRTETEGSIRFRLDRHRAARDALNEENRERIRRLKSMEQQLLEEQASENARSSRLADGLYSEIEAWRNAMFQQIARIDEMVKVGVLTDEEARSLRGYLDPMTSNLPPESRAVEQDVPPGPSSSSG